VNKVFLVSLVSLASMIVATRKDSLNRLQNLVRNILISKWSLTRNGCLLGQWLKLSLRLYKQIPLCWSPRCLVSDIRD